MVVTKIFGPKSGDSEAKVKSGHPEVLAKMLKRKKKSKMATPSVAW